MAAEALKLMGDVKVKIEELGLLLSDAVIALQDEKTASYGEGVAAGKAEAAPAEPPAEAPVPSVDVEAIKVELDSVKAALAKLQGEYSALMEAVKVEIEDAKVDSARLEAALPKPVEAPAEQQV